MATQQLPEQLIAKYRSVQLDRLDRIEGCWRELHDTAYSREREADLVRGFNALKNDSRAMGFADISFLCQKLEDLLFFARQRRYQVSGDVDMLVTMALQFTAILIRRKFDAAPSGVDLTGFVRQMDEVLRMAQASDTPEPGLEQAADGEAEHISAATRQRLARVATTVYLESLNAWGGSVARLREAWDALVKEAASLEAVALQALFAPERTAALSRARELGRPVEIFFDVGAHRVPGDVADALREAVRLALRHAVERGIEPSDQRAGASKRDVATVRVRAREEGDRLEVVVEDDGRGADLEAIRRRGVDLGLLTQEQAAAASDESLVELLFHPRFAQVAAQP
ncbi:MAG TPA: hypothetical protein VK447_16160, partial [Myxococcaceae bacterium]|nr:hypothetical protein [Myxococcaceae bacterium]